MNKFLFGVVFLPIALFGQHSLKVNVANVKNSTGFIRVAAYNNAEDFLTFDRVYKSSKGAAEKGITTLYVKDLPVGVYALAVFHDENSNEKMDTNFLGIPKEPVGFSNAQIKTFGPPSFKECSFVFNEDRDIKLTIK